MSAPGSLETAGGLSWSPRWERKRQFLGAGEGTGMLVGWESCRRQKGVFLSSRRVPFWSARITCRSACFRRAHGREDAPGHGPASRRRELGSPGAPRCFRLSALVGRWRARRECFGPRAPSRSGLGAEAGRARLGGALEVCTLWPDSCNSPPNTPLRTSSNNKSDLFFYELVYFWSIIDYSTLLVPWCTA